MDELPFPTDMASMWIFFKTNEILCHCDGPICVITSRHSGVVLVTLVLYVNLVGM